MSNTFQVRFIAAAASVFALLGTACDMGSSAATADGCTVTVDYKFSCPDGDDVVIKPN